MPTDVPPVPEPGASARPVPPVLAVALGGVVAEAVALLVVAAWLMVELVRGRSSSVPVTLFLVAFAAVVALALVTAARGLRRGGPFGRAPVLGWQLLQGATALPILQAAGSGPGAVRAAGAALVMAVVVGVLVLTPPAVRFTTAR